MKTIAGFVAGLTLASVATQAFTIVPVSSPAGLGSPTVVSWGGTGWNQVLSGSAFTSGGVTVNVTSGSGDPLYQSVQGATADDSGNTWNGNFVLDESVIYNGVSYFGSTPSGIGLHFATPVLGAGIHVEQNWSSAPDFDAVIAAFDINNGYLGSYSFHGLAGQSADGTAVFAGFLSSIPNISSLYITTDSNDFAIGALSVNVPLPDFGSTAALLGLGVAGLCLIQKRK